MCTYTLRSLFWDIRCCTCIFNCFLHVEFDVVECLLSGTQVYICISWLDSESPMIGEFNVTHKFLEKDSQRLRKLRVSSHISYSRFKKKKKQNTRLHDFIISTDEPAIGIYMY